MNIVEKIQSLCTDRKTTIAELERELEFSRGSIRKWISSSPSAEKLAKVSKYFNVSIDYLINDNDNSQAMQSKVIDKLIMDTRSGKIKWGRFDVDTHTDSLIGDKLNERFSLSNFSAFIPEDVLQEDKSYYAEYESGGYLFANILNTKTDKNYFYLFVYYKNKFTPYADAFVYSNLYDLNLTIKKQVDDVDDFIKQYLTDKLPF